MSSRLPPFINNQTCESGEALLEALKGKREFMVAIAQRKVRAQGNLAKLSLLKGVFEGAASTAVDQGSGGPPMLVPLPKSEWEPDGPACSQCQARFSLTNRRHHCRCVCGGGWWSCVLGMPMWSRSSKARKPHTHLCRTN